VCAVHDAVAVHAAIPPPGRMIALKVARATDGTMTDRWPAPACPDPSMQCEHTAPRGPVSIADILHGAPVALRHVSHERMRIREARGMPGTVDEERVHEALDRPPHSDCVSEQYVSEVKTPSDCKHKTLRQERNCYRVTVR
jgi:hypothetical protein